MVGVGDDIEASPDIITPNLPLILDFAAFWKEGVVVEVLLLVWSQMFEVGEELHSDE